MIDLENIKGNSKEKINEIKNETFRQGQHLDKTKMKKSKKIFAFVGILLTTAYLIGLITQGILLIQEQLKIEDINYDIFNCLFYAFNLEHSKYLWIVSIFIVVIISLKMIELGEANKGFSKKGTSDDRGFFYSEKGDFGTNRIMSIPEMERVFHLTETNNIPSIEELASYNYKDENNNSVISTVIKNLLPSNKAPINIRHQMTPQELNEQQEWYNSLNTNYHLLEIWNKNPNNKNNELPNGISISEGCMKNDKEALAKVYKESKKHILNRSQRTNKENIPINVYGNQTILGQEITPSGERGRLITWAKDSYYNPNIFVIGSPGTMKTRCLANTYVLQCLRRKESIVCIDTKGSLYSLYSEMARSIGYSVYILNFCDLSNSDGWNPLANCNSIEKTQQICDIIIKNTTDGKGEKFYDDGEQLLLTALIQYVCLNDNIPDENKTLPYIYNLLISYNLSQLDKLFSELEIGSPAKLAWFSFYKGEASKKNCSNFLQGLLIRLQLLQSKELQGILSTNTISTTDLGLTPTIIFLRFPDQSLTYKVYTSLFMTLLHIDLVALADATDELVLPVKVSVLGDEFCNSGEIPDYTNKISTIRSRGICSIIIIQDIPQFANRYDDDRHIEIASACDVLVFLGANDTVTAKYVSDLTGEATISQQGDSKMSALNQVRIGESYSTGKRMVYTVGEILSLPIDMQLIRVRGNQVLKCYKYDSVNHPDSKYSKPINAKKHIPVRTYNGLELLTDIKINENTPTSNSTQNSSACADNNSQTRRIEKRAIEREAKQSLDNQPHPSEQQINTALEIKIKNKLSITNDTLTIPFPPASQQEHSQTKISEEEIRNKLGIPVPKKKRTDNSTLPTKTTTNPNSTACEYSSNIASLYSEKQPDINNEWEL